MKLPLAYSTDCEVLLNIEEAYDLLWAGLIKDKRNFECPSEHCNARIIATNLDRYRFEMIREPYFKAQSDHNPACVYCNTDKTRISQKKTLKSDVDIFKTGLSQDLIRSKVNDFKNQSKEEKKRNAQKSYKKTYGTTRKLSYSSVRALVSKYYENPNRMVSIKDFKILYKDLFIKVNGQDYNGLSRFHRIYYGEATVYRLENDSYNVRFKDFMIFKGKTIQPSTYIDGSKIKMSVSPRLYEEKLNTHKTVRLFLYGTPKVKESNDRTYLNIYLDKLEYLDIRSTEEISC